MQTTELWLFANGFASGCFVTAVALTLGGLLARRADNRAATRVVAQKAADAREKREVEYEATRARLRSASCKPIAEKE